MSARGGRSSACRRAGARRRRIENGKIRASSRQPTRTRSGAQEGEQVAHMTSPTCGSRTYSMATMLAIARNAGHDRVRKVSPQPRADPSSDGRSQGRSDRRTAARRDAAAEPRRRLTDDGELIRRHQDGLRLGSPAGTRGLDLGGQATRRRPHRCSSNRRPARRRSMADRHWQPSLLNMINARLVFLVAASEHADMVLKLLILIVASAAIVAARA